MKRIVNLLLIYSLLSFSAMGLADQHGTCSLRSGGVAYYHCPEGYDAIISGDGTDTCDGECYRRGDKGSLDKALFLMVERRGISPYAINKAEIDAAARAILNRSCSDLTIPGTRPLQVCPGREGDNWRWRK